MVKIEEFFINVTTYSRNKTSQDVGELNKQQDYNGNEKNLAMGMLSNDTENSQKPIHIASLDMKEIDPLIRRHIIFRFRLLQSR